jgi:TatD DNase family protein
MLTDAHCHLELETYGEELPAVMQRARAAGIRRFIAVGASGVTAGADEALRLAHAEADVYAAVGIHPHEAHLAAQDPAALPHIARCLKSPRAVCLGEVGLDYHYDRDTAAVQRQILDQFIEMAVAHAKPLMLHVREAHADCLAALAAQPLPGGPGGPGVVHCFTAGPQEAAAYIELGFYLSIAGVVTFKNAGALREAVRQTPLVRLLVETDCPYLAPVPYRGKRNEPAYLTATAAAVAELKEISPAELGRATSANAGRLFGVPDVD